MSHEIYDPAKQPGDPHYHTDPSCCPQCGPGGNSTLSNGDEKGILETYVHSVLARHEQAALGSDHDSHKQGIYTTNSRGDND
jgi:hypothetical protein